MQDLEKLGQELERMGKTEEIKKLADSDMGRRIGKMVDTRSLEAAARSGDTQAIKGLLSQLLSTEEGKKLAERVQSLMNGG